MKKQVLSFIFLAAMCITAFGADRILADFEGGVIPLTNPGAVADVLTIVDNPASGGINTSAKVLKIDRPHTTGNMWDQRMAVTLSPQMNLKTHPIISLKAYATDTIRLGMVIDNTIRWEQQIWAGQFDNKFENMDVIPANGWQELTVDLSKFCNADYTYISLLILSHNDADTNARTVYIDDFKLKERSPAFDANTIVPIWFEQFAMPQWVGSWASTTDASGYGYYTNNVAEKAGGLKVDGNGYARALPTDTILGASGGMHCILDTTNGGAYQKIILGNIPIQGVTAMNLKFHMAYTGGDFTNGAAPNVEYAISEEAGTLDTISTWQALTVTGFPTTDSTWTIASAAISETGNRIAFRFTGPSNERALRIDDITLEGKVTLTTSMSAKGIDDLDIVTVGGTLPLEVTVAPAGAPTQLSYKTMNLDTAQKDALISIADDGTITGLKVATSGIVAGKTNVVRIFATTLDGTEITDSLDVTVQADAIKIATITITEPAEAAAANVDDFLTYSATVKPANATNKVIEWTTNDAKVATINKTTGVLRVLAEGTVTITATAADKGGATDTVNLSVGTSIANNIASQFNIYPNPASNSLFINSVALISNVDLINITGMTVLSKVCNSTNVNLNLSELTNGIYMLRISTVTGETFVQKLIKK